jgi:hypothetical protein
MSQSDRGDRERNPDRIERAPVFWARARLLGIEYEIGFRAADLTRFVPPGSGVLFPPVPWTAKALPAVSSWSSASVEAIARWEDEGGAGG